MTMKNDLKVTGVRYYDTRRGIGYECTTNIDGVRIWNDGMGGITFIEGTWSLIKSYQHLNDNDLENLIDAYENSLVTG
jgi:hypothetical protein